MKLKDSGIAKRTTTALEKRKIYTGIFMLFMKKKRLALLAALALTVLTLSACGRKAKITDDNLAAYVHGITDLYIIRGSEGIDYMKNVTYDTNFVKGVTFNADDVDLTRVNEYDLVYTIKLDPGKAYYKSEKKTEIQKTVTVKVVTESVSKKLAEESVKKIVIWGDNSVDITAEAEDD